MYRPSLQSAKDLLRVYRRSRDHLPIIWYTMAFDLTFRLRASLASRRRALDLTAAARNSSRWVLRRAMGAMCHRRPENISSLEIAEDDDSRENRSSRSVFSMICRRRVFFVHTESVSLDQCISRPLYPVMIIFHFHQIMNIFLVFD